MGALGIFFPQSPSLVESQRRLHHTTGPTNAHTLFDVEQMPWDNQVRTLRDPIAPSALDAVFVEVFERLEQPRRLAHFRVLGDQLFVALDGPNYFSSKAMQCPNCLRRQLSHGPTLSYHAAITPVIVCPGPAQVLALPPAYLMPQAGHDQQDGERAAGKRWLATHAPQVAPQGVTCLGDALSNNQPFCERGLPHGVHVILTCKPDSHPKRYERVALWQATAAIAEHAARHFNGRFTAVTMVRSINDVLLRRGDNAWGVHWCDLTVVNANTGEQLSHNSSITTHRLTADNGVAIAHAGRGRWKIENENNNVLKTQGDHLEHNFGHGKQYLAACMLSLNLRAFLFHTVLEWSDAR